MTSLLSRAVERALAVPLVFELQQRLCNDYGSVLEEFRPFLEVRGRRILDFGCSTGACASRIVDMRANEYLGIDADPKYVDVAARLNPDGAFRVMDAAAMDAGLAAGSFDVVLINSVLHHIDDAVARESLRAVRRVVKPDGVVLVNEPAWGPHNNPLGTFLLTLDRGHHIRTLDATRALFAGFRVERERFMRFSFVHRLCAFVLRKA